MPTVDSRISWIAVFFASLGTTWPAAKRTGSSGRSNHCLHPFDIPKGEIQTPFPANFNHQIQLLGVSVREVLEWPTSFEVTYYWQCLKKTESNLRVFVHVTTPVGQTVYQQDHWPLAGHLPTSRWEVGDVVRERYVMVLPGGLSPGRYQIRVGWFDPKGGPRLPVANPSGSDGEDRAPVADVEVHRAPWYRWFSVEY